MPELPEVETMVRDLRPRVTGHAIADVEAEFRGEIIYPDFPTLRERAIGQVITRIWRRGKYAVLELSGGDSLIIHRGMSGSLLLRAAGEPMESHVQVLFRLDDGRELRLNDPRKFGKVFLMRSDGSERAMPWTRFGPEPLEESFTTALLTERLHGRTASIKPLLLNQEIVAGLGNIYVDEALHLARIHPEQRANTLSHEQRERLRDAIQRVLGIAVEGRGTTFSNYMDIEGRAGTYQNALRVFRKPDTPCPECGTPIERMVVGGRGTHVCPRCQPKL